MKPTDPSNRLSSLHYLLLFICFAVYPSFGLQAQDLLTKANQLNDQFKQEKIYLHIDRPSYWANEDIWFKAYLKDSPKPDCNLYVELLNEKGAVIYKKMLGSEWFGLWRYSPGRYPFERDVPGKGLHQLDA